MPCMLFSHAARALKRAVMKKVPGERNRVHVEALNRAE
jgi:hypothetical protein